MDRLWKQFAASDTDFRSNVFWRARLKLTSIYVLIVAVIIVGFSIFLYQSINRNLKDAGDDNFTDAGSHQQVVETTLGSVANEIMLADLVILLVSAGVSYVLAGKTLWPIQQSLEAQKAFAANASHELRTPLAVVRNDIEVFLRNPTANKESAQTVMKSNLEEVGHMSDIVENLLMLARSDNRSTSKLTQLDLNVVTKDIVKKMHPLASNNGIDLTFEGTETCKVKGASHLLDRALLNILQNSIDHTKSGGSILVTLNKEARYAHLTISDTGSGIAEKDLPHIFTRSIVKELVEQHSGRIAIESQEGAGTTVSLYLPLL
jgi:two-component system sensor histidine kinase CiaH